MIDLHCHLLPEVDDGAQTMTDMLAMVEKAKEDGITAIVATPHHNNGHYQNIKANIIDCVEKVNDYLTENNVDFTVLPGQECRITGELLTEYEQDEILTLNHSKYLFIELPSSNVPKYTSKLLYDLQLNGLIPVIVHPERNRELMEHPDKLYRLVEQGALTQITAASVIGLFGKKIKSFTDEIIDANLSHFIASDAHNVTNRSFHLRAAYDRIQQEFSEELVYFYSENAEYVIRDEYIMKEHPERIRRRKKFFGIF
ncbi:protein-tyrosine phosphatase [Evansella caseinilytica]|uniref:Tyrosine-protein phosphatase n=1 Tax=Evansella caseinilytica TaxID=1503961 RepID=A0A1H3TAZ9_9BACI|nr:CpsB/CapC family capsule biosynthesis tyrosine phosphatase [Evansella caseinilytica]SDZ46499.1 protein-tyrosine phosphatase [Evansella caseinilytica]